MVPLKLNSKNLSHILVAGEAQVKDPTYQRDGAVKEGIVHIGIGSFHEAHLAVYVDQLM